MVRDNEILKVTIDFQKSPMRSIPDSEYVYRSDCHIIDYKLPDEINVVILLNDKILVLDHFT